MKLFLPLPLLTYLLTVSNLSAQTSTDLGDTMFIGDSITHGISTGSYRWDFHKILADNGISYDETGIHTDNFGGDNAPSSYGGLSFENVHSAHSSGRAWEVSGEKQGTRYSGSNIKNWLGQDANKQGGSAYTGPTFTGEDTPETFVMMIGTNDMLSDFGHDDYQNGFTGASGNSGEPADAAELRSFVLQRVQDSIASMKLSNADANIYLTSVPAWGEHATANVIEQRESVALYNQELASWAATQSNVHYIDINKGFIDVASGQFKAHNSFTLNTSSDKLHPSEQGNLIIAGNLAKSMGLAGRSAGQQRRASEQLGVNFYEGGAPQMSVAALQTGGMATLGITDAAAGALVMESNSTISYNWAAADTLAQGYTIDFNLALGDGAAGGWDTTDLFTLSVDNGSQGGQLHISEAYIKWGNDVLYSMDMSTNIEDIRISYIMGDQGNNLDAGYYVWLGDQLIGESLASTSSTLDGFSLSYNGSDSIMLNNLAFDGNQSYAPTSSLTSDRDGYIAAPYVERPLQPGEIAPDDWATGLSAQSVVSSGSASDNLRLRAGITSGDASIKLTGVSSDDVLGAIGNVGNYTGNIWVDVTDGEITRSGGGWYAIQTTGTLTGDGYLRFTENAAGTASNKNVSVFAAVNATSISGNAYLEFSSESLTLNSFTSTEGKQVSVMATYNSSIDGDMTMVFNAGTFNYRVLGGAHTGNTSIAGQVKLYLNGGQFNGDVMGGGFTGTIGSSSLAAGEARTALAITGGNFNARVIGGSAGSTISGDARIDIEGGSFSSHIVGGNVAGTLDGSSSVTISGTAANFTGGESQIIMAGSTAGNHTGSATVKLSNITDKSNAQGIDKFSGSITGGAATGSKQLIFDTVTAEGAFQNTSISGFDSITLHASQVTLTKLEMGESLDIIFSSADSILTLQDITISSTSELNVSKTYSTRSNQSQLRFKNVNWEASTADGSLTKGESDLTTLEGGSFSNVLTYSLTNIPVGEITAEDLSFTLLLTAAEYDELFGTLALPGELVAFDLGVKLGAGSDFYNDISINLTDGTRSSLLNPLGYYTNASGNTVLYIPEPSTATLSLLALAGLLARRRRHANEKA